MILGVIGDDFTGSSDVANHGPVAAGSDLEAAVYAMEELEETARLALLTRGLSPRLLTQDQVRELATRFRS